MNAEFRSVLERAAKSELGHFAGKCEIENAVETAAKQVLEDLDAGGPGRAENWPAHQLIDIGWFETAEVASVPRLRPTMKLCQYLKAYYALRDAKMGGMGDMLAAFGEHVRAEFFHREPQCAGY